MSLSVIRPEMCFKGIGLLQVVTIVGRWLAESQAEGKGALDHKRSDALAIFSLLWCLYQHHTSELTNRHYGNSGSARPVAYSCRSGTW